MNYIVINGSTTDDDVRNFKEIFSKLTTKDKAVYASVNYKYPIPDEDDMYLKYPLVIYTKDGYAFCIRNVSAGFGGTGPHGMVECLKYAGFEFDENIILDHQPRGVKFTLCKEDLILCPRHKELPYFYLPICDKKNKCYGCTV